MSLKNNIVEFNLCDAVIESKGSMKKFCDLLMKAYQNNINGQDDNGNTPMMLAAMYGDVKLVKLLLKKKPNMIIENKKGITARQFAVGHQGKSSKIVKLIDKYLNPLDFNNKLYFSSDSDSTSDSDSNYDIILDDKFINGNNDNFKPIPNQTMYR